MKNQIKTYSAIGIIFIVVTTFLLSCDKMDRTYSEFLESGQIIYNAKLDSVRIYPGRDRILVTWKPISDPRITKVKVFWSNDEGSTEKAIESRNDTTLLIENLSEGNYTFNFITYDDEGNSSMKVEILGTVHGELYESSLLPRQVRDMELSNNNLTIYFNSTEQLNKYYAQEIKYTSSIDHQEKTIVLSTEASTVEIDDYSGDKFQHRSIYLPSELSPDFFYTETITKYTPKDPLLEYPQDGSTEVNCAPEFQWYNSALLTDAKYQLEYSTDQSDWRSIPVSGQESLIPKTILEPNTKYYWRVSATKGSEIRVSNINSFTTGERTLYADGEAVRVQEHTSGFKPVRLAIMGDGFQQNDFIFDGAFDKYAEEAISAFFSVEPYKSYREYFEVWKVAAYSEDGGISESDKSIRLNTAFESNFAGNTLACNTSKVHQYAKYIPGINDAELSNMATIVILNKRRQGGFTYTWNNGRSIALVPVFRNYTSGLNIDFSNVIIRQGGGFGFGLLADETNTIPGTLSVSEENELREAWSAGRFLNIDLTNDPEEVRWAHFIGRSGYMRPNIFEGAYGFRNGIYRCEEYSSMVNGIKYFSAISRELIVKRIMRIAGETYSFEKFLEKDVARTPYQ